MCRRTGLENRRPGNLLVQHGMGSSLIDEPRPVKKARAGEGRHCSEDGCVPSTVDVNGGLLLLAALQRLGGSPRGAHSRAASNI